MTIKSSLCSFVCLGLVVTGSGLSCAVAQDAKPEPTPIKGYRDTPVLPGTQWHVHDPERPQPKVVQPGRNAGESTIVQPPADAIVLFDGHDLSAWTDEKNQATKWQVSDGAMVPAEGSIRTKQNFGDAQVHVEFNLPVPAKGEGQERGNSGVFLQGLYEVQVLDSYQNRTYPDGQAGAIYGQYPPLVNAACPPGQWQTFDIIFTAARFAPDGSLQIPAYLTVFHNGVLVQNHAALLGSTVHRALAKYEVTDGKGPLGLQYHGNAVRYRNIWVRPLKNAADAGQ